MTTWTKWLPGPTQAEQYSDLLALKTAIRNEAVAKAVCTNVGAGEPSGTYYLSNAWYIGGAQPYLACSWYAGAGNELTLRFRFNPALYGMLDPFTWFPDIFTPLGTFNRDQFTAFDSYFSVFANELAAAVRTANLCGGNISSTVTTKTYTWGENAGKTYGLAVSGYYEPTAGEQEEDPPILRTDWTSLFAATDASDGTIGYLYGGGTAGVGSNNVPQAVSTTPDQTVAWDGLSDAVGAIKDEAEKSGVPLKRDTVTHPSDVGQPGDLGYQPPVPGAAVLGGAGNLPAIIVNESITLLSSVPAILVAAVGAIGLVASKIANSGFVAAVKDAAVQALGWGGQLVTIATNTATAAGQVGQVATNTECACTQLTRIADALEAIQDELCRDAEDPVAHPGIVKAAESAAETRHDIELLTHGTRFSVVSGGMWEEEP